jgi:phosphoribosylamine--glycine ligase
LEWNPTAAVTVVLASAGYPEEPKIGREISGITAIPNTHIFHAGTTVEAGRLISTGGRVLAITGVGPDLASARSNSYQALTGINLAGSHYRKDIALKASINENGA